MKLLTKYDVYIVVFLLIISLVSYCFIGFAATGKIPDTIEISVDGKPYASYRLSAITSTKQIEINTEYGKNILEISHDGAQMLDSNCKDRIDVKCGKITKAGQVIVCIPNRVVVKLAGSDNTVDKVTY